MLQHLLAERFQLKVHTEARQMPVYALVLEEGGIKAQPVVYEEADADQCIRPLPTGLEAHHCSMAAFSKALAGDMLNLGRPVLDRTGQIGRFDFTLKYLTRGFAPLLDPPPDTPTIFDALKTIGLKVQAQKAPAEVLVIDHVNKTPTENRARGGNSSVDSGGFSLSGCDGGRSVGVVVISESIPQRGRIWNSPHPMKSRMSVSWPLSGTIA
jgi:uncharacterized protein (TIGR03435 family)